jgi:hypothetical protein
MWLSAASRPRAIILASTPWRKMSALRSIAIFPIRNVSEAPSGSSGGNVLIRHHVRYWHKADMATG